MTVGSLLAELRVLLERGNISLNDPVVLEDLVGVTTVTPMTGFVETDGRYQFQGELDPEDTTRLVFIH
jgi:hypothetical protein